MMPFDEAWQRCESITGWLTREEGRALYAAAARTPADGLIVEIGAYHGRSTVLLACSGRRVVTIDPLIPGSTGEGYTISEDDALQLHANLAPFTNVIHLRRGAQDVTLTAPIHMLYIDGVHRDGVPLADLAWFFPLLTPGAQVCLHDFGQWPDVGRAIANFERNGRLRCVEIAQTMYVGARDTHASQDCRIFLARPWYDRIEPESIDAEQRAIDPRVHRVALRISRMRRSLLASCFNALVAQCLNTGGYDFFAMLHADLVPDAGWLSVMTREMCAHDLDVLHAVAPIKNHEGLTSTGIAHGEEPWQRVRRLTMREVHDLPTTFTIQHVRERIDADARWLLPNTGCLLVRTRVLEDFPGFQISDRLVREFDGRWRDQCLPEDWNFGLWCGVMRIAIGGTRAVRLAHYGRHAWPNDQVWGLEHDLV